MTFLDRAQFESIVESAIQAPSADNQHRLMFESTESGVRIWGLPGEFGTLRAYKRALTLISLGSVAENIAIAASHLKLNTRFTISPDPARPDLILEVGFELSNVTPDPIFRFIPLRHTNRRFFHGPGLGQEQKAQWELSVSTAASCRLYWLDGPSLRKEALRLIRLAEAERFRNRLLHEELFAAIRFDIGWKTSCEEKLPPGALEVEPPLRPLFASLRHWSVMRMANLIGAYRLLGLRAGDMPCRLAPNLGMLAVEKVNDENTFSTGRHLQRIWLDTTNSGLGFQPMPASGIYALEGTTEQGIPAALQTRLALGWRNIVPGWQPLMLFRIGRAAPPSLFTQRKPLRDYLLSTST